MQYIAGNLKRAAVAREQGVPLNKVSMKRLEGLSGSRRDARKRKLPVMVNICGHMSVFD